MSTNDASSLPFMKMHGLGNDFVVIDRRAGGRKVSESLVLALGDRHRGVGFDQLAVIEPHDSAAAKLIFYNSDGSASAACGNATRCIAAHLMDESGHTALSLVTERGTLPCERRGDLVSVNMGAPVLDWRDIPLAQEVDTLALPIDGAPVATGMGNPHCTFFVDNADAIDLAARGAEMERHPLYPERTNVQFASLIAPDRLRMRVWERGVGVTLASGSSSCAVAVAAARTGRTGRHVTLTLDGGTLDVEWRDDGVWMTGPTAHVFNGELTDAFLSAL